jgi:hypothetical protein
MFKLIINYIKSKLSFDSKIQLVYLLHIFYSLEKGKHLRECPKTQAHFNKCNGMQASESKHWQMKITLGVGVFSVPQIFETKFEKTNIVPIGFFRLLKRCWIIDIEMGSHSPFGYLRHKIWLNEWIGVKLTIWFMNMKTWETRVKWFQLEHVTKS